MSWWATSRWGPTALLLSALPAASTLASARAEPRVGPALSGGGGSTLPRVARDTRAPPPPAPDGRRAPLAPPALERVIGRESLAESWVRALPAHAAVEAGGGIGAFRDLRDPFAAGQDARFGLGPDVRGLLRLPVGPSTWVRFSLDAGLAFGHDRVEWSEYDGAVRYFSDDHWTMLTSTRFTVGPELGVGRSRAVRPFWGGGVGLAWVQNWHSFHLPDSQLMDPVANDLDDPGNIDPYTSQVVPIAGLGAGLVLMGLAPFAIEVEAGYYVAFLTEAALRRTSESVQAERTAFALNALDVGLAATVPVGGRADR